MKESVRDLKAWTTWHVDGGAGTDTGRVHPAGRLTLERG